MPAPAREPPGPRLPIEIVQPDNVPVLSIDGVFGGLDPSKGRLLFYSDRPHVTVNDDGVMVPVSLVRTFLADVRMSPETFLGIARWMGTHADQFEAWCAQEVEEGDKEELA